MPRTFASVTCINGVRYRGPLLSRYVLQADELLVLLGVDLSPPGCGPGNHQEVNLATSWQGASGCP